MSGIITVAGGTAVPATYVAVPMRRPVSIMLIGDSITKGGGSTEYIGAFRNALYVTLRKTRDDFQFIGANYEPVQGASTLGYWAHQGTSGAKIEDITAGYAGYVASAGQPDIACALIGVNNIVAGNSLATLQAKASAMVTAIRAASPNAHVMLSAVLPIVNGTSTVGSQASYDALRVAFNAWLPALTTGPRTTISLQSGASLTMQVDVPYGPISLLDYTAQMGTADNQADGIHPNSTGSGRMAAAVADALAVLMPPASGLPAPRSFVQRYPLPTVKLTTAATDSINIASVANLNPGSGDYMIGLNYRPSALTGSAGSGAFQSIITYGRQSTIPNFFTIAQRGPAIEVLWAGNSAAISDVAVAGLTPPNASCLVVDKWHRILLIVKQMPGGTADAALYINGRLSGYQRGITPATWNMTLQTLYIGASPDYNAAIGRVDGLRVWKGGSVPIPGSRAALVAAEADYFEGASACAGMSAQYEMSEGTGTSVASQIYLDNAGTFSGSPSWETTILRPWDYGFDAVP